MPGIRRVAVSLCVVVAASGCANASFRSDDSVDITGPAALTAASAPFQITWSAPPGPDRYAVFLDSAPFAPGATTRSLATDECKRLPTCWPDPTYLQGLGVYVSGPARNGVVSVRIESLTALNGIDGGDTDPVHIATLVRLDPIGHVRLGDESWQVEFHG